MEEPEKPKQRACPFCSDEIAPTYQGLYCSNCGKPLWDARPLQDQSEIQLGESETGSSESDREIQVFRSGQGTPPSEYHPQTTGPLPIRPLSHQPGAGTFDKTKYCLWEVRDSVGRVRAFFSTCFRACFTPAKFFGRMPPKSGYADALLFAVLVNLFGTIINLGWLILTRDFRAQLEQSVLADPWLGPLMERLLQQMPPITLTKQMLPVVGSPVYTIMWLVLFSILFHVFLFFVGGARKGFQATFRCLAYANSVNLVTALFSPMCGGFLWVFWMPIVVLIAFVKVHEIRLWRAVLAVVAPGLLVIALLVLSMLWFALTLLTGLAPV